MKAIRRLGKTGGPTGSSGRNACPDFFELDTGDFAFIGTDVTEQLAGQLPSDASVGPDERIILVRRDVVTTAKNDIPEE